MIVSKEEMLAFSDIIPHNVLSHRIKFLTFFEMPNIHIHLSKAWDLYKSKFLKLIVISLIETIFLLLFSIINASFKNLISTSYSQLEISQFVRYIILIIPVIGIASLSKIAMIYVVANEKKISIFKAYAQSPRKLISFIWINFLVAIIVLFGLILFIIPGIYWAIKYSFSQFVVILEDKKGRNALNTSGAYIKNHLRKATLRLLLPFFISFFIVAVTFFLPVSHLTQNAIQQIVDLFVTPFIVAYIFLLYRYLKTSK